MEQISLEAIQSLSHLSLKVKQSGLECPVQ